MCANALLLRFCTNYAYSVSMLDETGFYAPSMAHNALPSRPWLGISVFHVHKSTVSKQLRYSLSWQHVDARGGRGLRALRCGKIATNDAA